MGKSDAHFYRYRNKDNLHTGGLLGMNLKELEGGRWINIMKKDGMLVVDSRGKILGEILIDFVLDGKDMVGVLHRFSEMKDELNMDDEI